MKRACIAYVSFVAFLVVYWIVYAVWPNFHACYFLGEDRVVEWLSFYGWIVASLVVVDLLRRHCRQMSRLARLYLTGLALFFFICGGEELSWGQRLLGFKTPTAMMHGNEQSEFNLHNLRFKRVHPKDVVSMFVKTFGIVLPVVLAVAYRKRGHFWQRFVPNAAVAPCFVWAELVNLTEKRWARPLLAGCFGPDMAEAFRKQAEELTEMYWALAVLVAALALWSAWAESSAPPQSDAPAEPRYRH